MLEILKFRRLDAMRLRRLRPEASEAEIEADVAKDFETGEFNAIAKHGRVAPGGQGGVAGDAGGEQRVGERQVDQDGVGAEQEHGARRRRRSPQTAASGSGHTAYQGSSQAVETSSATVAQPAATRQSAPRAVRHSA